MNTEIYAQRLKALRTEKGCTQDELGALVGATKQVISRIEKNKNVRIDETLVNLLSQIFHCSKDYLKGDSDDPYKNKDGRTVAVIFDNQHEDKMSILEENFDKELLKLFIECNKKLSSKNRQLFINIVKAFINTKI